MGGTTIFSIVAAIMLSGIVAKQVSPSIVNTIKSQKVDSQIINNEKALFDSIQRYITLEGSNPASINDLTTKGYFDLQNNTNGFGGSFTFTIDSAKGKVTILTDISDSIARTSFINSYKNTFKPIQGTGNTVSTTFILPLDVMNSNGKFMTGIPIQDTAPSLTSSKYWYDTSGTETILKVSNGVAWKPVTSNNVNVSSSNIGSGVVATTTLATTTGVNGDVKYAFDSGTNAVQQYAYYNGAWVASGSTTNNSKYITTVNGARQWSNSTYATSCLKYIQSGASGYNYVGDTGDGVYTIDTDGAGPLAPFNVYCDQTKAGGGWTLVSYHNSSNGLYFQNVTNGLSYNSSNPGFSNDLYSILNLISNLKNDIKYEFLLYYPELNISNQWKQTFNPLSSASPTNPVNGYEAININANQNFWGGLEYDGSSSLLDGSVNHGNWWYALGTFNSVWCVESYSLGNCHPGPNSTPVKISHLYLR